MVAPATVEGRTPPLGRTALTWALVGLIGLVLSLGTRFFRPVARGMQVSRSIIADSSEYQRRIKNNEALAAEVAYLKTAQGTEWAVYKYTGMVKPGQSVGQVVVEPAPPVTPPDQSHRFRNWINQQRISSARNLHCFGEVLLCFFKLRPLDHPPKACNEGRSSLSKGTTDARPVTYHAGKSASSPEGEVED